MSGAFFQSQKYADCHIIEGKFRSPFALQMPGLVAPEVQDAFFQMVLPLHWSNDYKPVCIHLAGTGDHVSCFELIQQYVEILTFLVLLEKKKYDGKTFTKNGHWCHNT